MRHVLLVAVCLLLVALGLQRELPQPLANQADAAPSQRDLPVTILATGWKMDLPDYGMRKVFRGFFVGPREYRNDEGALGLSVMALPDGGGVAEIETFNMRYDLEDGLKFSQYLDQVEPGTVLLMGSATSIGKAGDQYELYNEKVSGLYRRIGAVSKPTQVAVQGFAYICLKREDGSFKPIAETYSETKGVRLSYVIPADRRTLLDVEPQRLRDARVLRPLALTEALGEDFQPKGKRNFRERHYDCLGATPGGGVPSTVTWKLEVPEDAPAPVAGRLFTAQVAMPWSSNPKVLGVRYTLFVNGELLGDFPIWNDPGSSAQWLSWEQHIPASLGPIQEVKVQADVLSLEKPSAEIFLADVLITEGRMERL
ncbi:MAG: hypothetical protein P1V81_06060 [Planctomycetota bacterium]|nr:hypothetical protein [Planctomycetota bacterium]